MRFGYQTCLAAALFGSGIGAADSSCVAAAAKRGPVALAYNVICTAAHDFVAEYKLGQGGQGGVQCVLYIVSTIYSSR